MKQFRSGCECDSFVCMQTSHAPCQKMRTLRPGIYRVMEGVSEESKADVAEEIASVAYRCRMCRLRLFSSEDIKYHKQAVHRLSQRGNKAKDAMPKGCSSHFIAEPMEWMHTDDVMGKINCPQCDARLGSYNWSGAQCSCGTWVTPAIQITQSRVDQVFVQPAPSDNGVTEEISEEPLDTVDVNT